MGSDVRSGANTGFKFWEHKVLTRFTNIKVILLLYLCPHHGWWQKESLISRCSKILNFRVYFAWKDFALEPFSLLRALDMELEIKDYLHDRALKFATWQLQNRQKICCLQYKIYITFGFIIVQKTISHHF